jgi:hypothetical protein
MRVSWGKVGHSYCTGTHAYILVPPTHWWFAIHSPPLSPCRLQHPCVTNSPCLSFDLVLKTRPPGRVTGAWGVRVQVGRRTREPCLLSAGYPANHRLGPRTPPTQHRQPTTTKGQYEVDGQQSHKRGDHGGDQDREVGERARHDDPTRPPTVTMDHPTSDVRARLGLKARALAWLQQARA